MPDYNDPPFWEDDDFERPVHEDPRQDGLHSNPDLRAAYNEGRDRGLNYNDALEYAYEQVSDGPASAEQRAEGSGEDETDKENVGTEEAGASESKEQRSFDDWDN